MNTFKELEVVQTTRDLLESILIKEGAVGTIVHCYGDENVYEVEIAVGDATVVVTVDGMDLELS